MADLEVLENPAWHALCGRQRALGVQGEGAAFYHRQISPFAALGPDATLDDLAGITEPGQPVVFMAKGHVEPSEGWKPVADVPVLQMVCTEPRHADYEPCGRELVPVTCPPCSRSPS